MSGFYPNSSAQVDVLSTPYVQDQKFTSYSESPMIHHGNMMMYLHGASSDGPFSEIAPGASMSTHNEMVFIPPNGDHIPMQSIGGQALDGERKLNGLSLSLSTHLSAAIPPASFEQFSNPEISPVGYNVHQYEQAGAARVIMKSTFLKAAQQLLDEVVNVQDALKQQESGKDQSMKKVEDGTTESKDKSTAASGVNESASVPCEELSATERQDLQNNLDKLLAMLDEVDRRYKQYYHQMQVLVSSFDMIAGCGAAKPYTTLALKAISRHFRCLRDALSVQIQTTRRSLGEQDSGQGGGVIPRLRYVDQKIRQQRALQQFGMMRHAWRPQRGLPENAVTTLRAWLFEHFLHPYPKDSEKIMLARHTGLTRSQVGNWFINARVRLWKPMVEEMYKEEFGEAELNLKSSPENAAGELQESFRSMADGGHHCNESKTSVEHHTTDMSHSTGRAGFMESPHGGDDRHKGLMRLHDNMNNHGFYPHDQNGAIAFQAPEVGRYGVNSQVSLALGLRRIDGASAENAVGPETAEYSYFGQVNQQQQQQQQHKFGNSHLLDDFVV